MAMCSINQCHLLPVLSHLTLKNSRTTKLLWLPIKEPSKLLGRQNFHSLHTTQRTQVFNDSSLLLSTISSPPPSPNIYVLIVTSVSLFLLYWISNFVVPDIVIKNLESTNQDDEQVAKEENMLEEMRSIKKRSSGTSSKL